MSVLLLVTLMSLVFGDTFLHMMSSCTMVIILKSIIHHEETVKQCHGKAIITWQRKRHLLACMWKPRIAICTILKSSIHSPQNITFTNIYIYIHIYTVYIVYFKDPSSATLLLERWTPTGSLNKVKISTLPHLFFRTSGVQMIKHQQP